MNIININNINDLNEYVEYYNALSSSLITTEILGSYTVYGLYTHNPHSNSRTLSGGFALGTKGPFRSLKVLTSPPQFDHAQLAHAEICCLWLAPAERTMKTRLRMVLAIHQALRIGGYSQVLAITTKKGLWENVYRPSGAKFIMLADAEFRKGVIRPAWLFTMKRENLLVLGVLNVLLRPISKLFKKFHHERISHASVSY